MILFLGSSSWIRKYRLLHLPSSHALEGSFLYCIQEVFQGQASSIFPKQLEDVLQQWDFYLFRAE